MATTLFARRINGSIIPADGVSAEALENLKPGVVYKIELKSSRQYKFLQKAFVLVNYAYEIWEPDEASLPEHRGRKVKVTKEAFRENLTILAGFYDPVVSIGGGVRPVAKSWSFSAMPDDEDFSKLYQGLITVIVEKVLDGYTGEDLDAIVNQIILGFA